MTQNTVYGLANSLQSLNLNANRLSTLAHCTFYGFSANGYGTTFDYFQLQLGSNPLRCDCALQWLYAVLRNAYAARLSTLPWTCDSGRAFSSLTAADFAGCPSVVGVNSSAVVPPAGGPTKTPLQPLLAVQV
jgi:hypothetical protein